jgi:pyridoxal phosphate enzyme (YggS family)
LGQAFGFAPFRLSALFFLALVLFCAPDLNRGDDMPLADINERIAQAEVKAGRPAGDVQLIAVSKVQPNARVAAVLDEGHRCFGENKVQEAGGKWPDFRGQYDGVDLHLIGPLQSNKARQAFELFQSIHTLDRMKLANSFARLAQEMGKCPDLFIQVNTGEEPQKAGVMPREVDGFVAECLALDLPVKGLMCIPPVEEEASLHFSLLAKMAKRNGLAGLSMGMSSDFERAIAFGATHIRVGSAIFGDRVSAT